MAKLSLAVFSPRSLVQWDVIREAFCKKWGVTTKKGGLLRVEKFHLHIIWGNDEGNFFMYYFFSCTLSRKVRKSVARRLLFWPVVENEKKRGLLAAGGR